jgi:hypothetical protein
MRIMMFLLFPLIGILYLTFFFFYQDCDCFVLFPLIGVLCFTGFVYPDCDIFGTVLSSWCFMLHWFCFAYPDCDYLIQFWPVCGTDVRIVIIWYSSDRCVALMYVLWLFDTVLTGVWHWCTYCDYFMVVSNSYFIFHCYFVLLFLLIYTDWLFCSVLLVCNACFKYVARSLVLYLADQWLL